MILIRAIGKVVFLCWCTAVLIIAIHVLTACSRKPRQEALNRHELNKRTFVTGTTKALKSFDPSPKKKPQLPIQ